VTKNDMYTESTNHGSMWKFQARLNSSLNIVRKFWQQTVRYCCNLSLLLCIIHMKKMRQNWRVTRYGNISIRVSFNNDPLLFALSYSPGQMWRWFTVFSVQFGLYILAGFVLCQGYIPEKHKNTKFPFKILYFLGVRGLTTSSYILYVYTTSGHTDL